MQITGAQLKNLIVKNSVRKTPPRPINMKDGGIVSGAKCFKDGGVAYAEDGGFFGRFFSTESNPQVERNRYYSYYIGLRNSEAIDKSIKFPEWYEEVKGTLPIDGKPLAEITPRDILEFVPIIGDALAAEELWQELKKTPVNWLVVGILSGGLAIGLIPGVGDAAAKAIREGGKMLRDGSKKAIDTLKQYELEIDPNTLGTAGGNIRIKKKAGRPAGSNTMYIQNKDGTVEEFTGTMAEFREQFGVGVSGSKKGRGRTDDGRQWSKSGEFKEFKSGAAKLDDELVDAETIEFLDEGRARLPKLDAELVDQLEDAVDIPLAKAETRYIDQEGLDVLENQETAEAVAKMAWPEIYPKVQELIKDLPVEKQNKILQWAKNRSRHVWGQMHEFQTKSRGVPGEAEPLEFIPWKQVPVQERVAFKQFLKENPDWEPDTAMGMTLQDLVAVHGNYKGRKKFEAAKEFEESQKIVAEYGSMDNYRQHLLQQTGEMADKYGQLWSWKMVEGKAPVRKRRKTEMQDAIIRQFDYPDEIVDVLVKYGHPPFNTKAQARATPPQVAIHMYEYYKEHGERLLKRRQGIKERKMQARVDGWAEKAIAVKDAYGDYFTIDDIVDMPQKELDDLYGIVTGRIADTAALGRPRPPGHQAVPRDLPEGTRTYREYQAENSN